MSKQLLAEWAPQRQVQLCWPSQAEYWGEQIANAQTTHSQIIAQITRYQRLLLIHSPDVDGKTLSAQLEQAGANLEQLTLVTQANNDIWCRDYGPLSIKNDSGQVELLDFRFTGWGGKFAAELDNAASQNLAAAGFYQAELRSFDLILEGGAIDYDGNGCLLTTTACLLNPNRNPTWERADYERFMASEMGIQRIHWLENGWLRGDDTDSHVDMLARFAPNNVLIYQGCQQTDDEHFAPLQALATELAALRNRDGQAYQLVELPFPGKHLDEDDDRLPASYANFLITNQQVLVPAYGDPQDEIARQTIAACFPNRETVSINCLALIHQYGSLHCASMQLSA